MKKGLLLLAFIFGTSLLAFAQKTPPQAVATTFHQKFPDVKAPKWGQEKNGEWEAEFDRGNAEMSANFNAAGQWLETETEINVSDLPAPVQAALKGKKVKEAAKIVRADGSTVYEAEVRRHDMVFDANGKLLSEEKD